MTTSSIPPIFTHADPAAAAPFAIAKPAEVVCLEKAVVLERVASMIGRSVCERFRGLGWVNDAGIACVIIVAHDDALPRSVAQAGGCGLLAWRWSITPSAYFSLTVMGRESMERPHTRWMAPSEDPTVRAIRREGWFYCLIGDPSGRSSGWLRASFLERDGAKSGARAEIERQWSFPLPTVSILPNRSDGDPPEPEDGRRAALWAEPEADFWATIAYNGPWQRDRVPVDTARGLWGAESLQKRSVAARLLEVLRAERHEDRTGPLTDEAGRWLGHGPGSADLRQAVADHPSLGAWLAALCGPEPTAASLQKAALQALHDAPACYEMLGTLFNALYEHGNKNLHEAFKSSLMAALLDPSVTDSGRRRPYLTYDGQRGFALKSIDVNLTAPVEDLEALWVDGFEIIDLIDTGVRLGPDDFPCPHPVVTRGLQNVTLEGTVEEAEQKVRELLEEAQAARQWSVPWGARVELRFGPFVAMRIFESHGEFSCLFLDEHERYFHVAIGLQHTPPRAVAGTVLRRRADDGEYAWNDEGRASLELIAAATVRDFLVVEDRESVFAARPFRRRVRGRDIRTVIYLPRVRYTRVRPEGLPGHPSSGARPRHEVSGHLRRASASTEQRFIAERYGVRLPEGFTFVRPHQRGGAAEQERVRVYRSRSASRMLFEALATAPEGARPQWFEFEKDCARLLRARGMRVIHQAAQRDGDGGVDLFAVDEDDQGFVAQCKCWALHRPVGPEVIRELEGAIRLADKGGARASRGIVITTSTFTEGAVAAAAALGFELIDGTALVREINASPK